MHWHHDSSAPGCLQLMSCSYYKRPCDALPVCACCVFSVCACVRAYAQEEQRRRDTASRKLLAEREIKRRREAEGVGCGA
eukprot:COSAG06_NODE_12649_length_1347_cov_144.629808_1_plen_79_part_10